MVLSAPPMTAPMNAPPPPAAPVPKSPPVPLLVGMAAGVSFCMNAFVPSIPGLTRAFDTSPAMAQLVLTLFLFGVALGQPIVGPLSDRFGRRPVLLAGLTAGLIASVACLLAPTIEILVAARLVQALGACTGVVIGRAMVSDIWGRERGASVLGYLTAGLSAMTLFAPVVGGLLDAQFGWPAVFLMMLALFAVMLGWSLFSVGETNLTPTASIAPLAILSTYASLCRNRRFVGYTFVVTFTSGAFFAFVGGVPHLMVTVLGRSPAEYGVWFGAMTIAFLTGTLLTGRLSQRVGLDRMIRLGILCSGLPSGFIMLGLALAGFLHPLTLFLPMAGIALGNGLCQANATAGAVATNPRLAGAAAGLLGMVQMLSASATTFVIGLILTDTAVPLGILCACLLSIGAASILLTRPARS